MEEAKVISGNSLEEVWQKISEDLKRSSDLFEYSVIIEQQGRSISLDIDMELGGEFEEGYELTRFASDLMRFDDFRFNLHRQGFIEGIGKFFGMEDIIIGYPEFDKEIIVKTNHPDRLKDILSVTETRELLLSLPDFEFHIGHHHSAHTEVESAFLELRIDKGITDAEKLRPIYNCFIIVLEKVDLNRVRV